MPLDDWKTQHILSPARAEPSHTVWNMARDRALVILAVLTYIMLQQKDCYRSCDKILVSLACTWASCSDAAAGT